MDTPFVRCDVRNVYAGAFARLRKMTISFVMLVCPFAWNNSAPTGRIFMKFCIWVFIENLSWKLKVSLKSNKITVTLHEDQYTFMIIARSVILRMRNSSRKICRENQNTHFMFSNFCLRKLRHLWDNVGKCSRAGQATDDDLYVACALHAGYLSLQTYTQNMYYLLFFHGNSGFARALQHYIYTYSASLFMH
jgi:hypothetical protein